VKFVVRVNIITQKFLKKVRGDFVAGNVSLNGQKLAITQTGKVIITQKIKD